MADTDTSAPPAIPGILGQLDPDTMQQLQQLAQQFGTNDADKKQALTQGLMAAGFGILGGHGIVNALGNAAQGLNQYNEVLQQSSQRRTQGLSQAMQALTMQRQMTMMQGLNKYLNLLQQGPQTAGTGAPQTFQIPGGAQGMMNAGVSGQMPPAPNQLPTQQPVPGQPDPIAIRNNLAMFNAANVAMGGKDMSSALQFAFPNPVSLRGQYVFDPRTGQQRFNAQMQPGEIPVDPNNPGAGVQSQPGYADVKTGLAKFERPVEVPVDTGGTKPVPFDQWVTGNYAVTPTPAQAKATTAANGLTLNGQYTPDQLRAIAADAEKQAVKPVAAGAPNAPPTTPAQLAASTTTGPVDPGSLSNEPRLYQGSIPPPPQTTATVGMPQSTQAKGMAENVVTQSNNIFTDVTSRAQAANKSQGYSTAIENLLGEVGKTGVTTPILIQAGQIAVAAGVSPDLVKSITGSVSAPAEALQKLIAVTAGQAVKQNVSASRPTQFEYGTLLNATPNPGMQQQAWTAALRVMHGTESSTLAEQQAMTDWNRLYKGDLTQFPAWWVKNNPDTVYLPSKDELHSIFAAPVQNRAPSNAAAPAAPNANAGRNIVWVRDANGRLVRQQLRRHPSYLMGLPSVSRMMRAMPRL